VLGARWVFFTYTAETEFWDSPRPWVQEFRPRTPKFQYRQYSYKKRSWWVFLIYAAETKFSGLTSGIVLEIRARNTEISV
jgi:hypothetical protein